MSLYKDLLYKYYSKSHTHTCACAYTYIFFKDLEMYHLSHKDLGSHLNSIPTINKHVSMAMNQPLCFSPLNHKLRAR